MAPNPYIMAAENSPDLLPLLRERSEIASGQDEHGYSLIHAAASYNHLHLLRTLVHELHVPVDLRDEDAETALFVVETVEAARCLVEELGLDASIRGDEGMTAYEKIAAEGDFPLVAEYLQGLAENVIGDRVLVAEDVLAPPQGVSIAVESLTAAEVNAGTMAGATTEPDPEFRRRIEELASREDFHTQEGQETLRQLVEDALSGQN
ncbi:ankyrin repeat protein [Grosmannia clavigera kw1407]|uniref:Ankyrin repeat protein n=1 Tax=Grosmannia clavigera (strain kw1407 / UAMH 11150) TaxID=655863 RepID=F0XNT9_GROCL|nr:ankyrin repeat protein [Grosmannia clavigera kw1407]EFX00613.1 ankyrin repeat protein [Grosmannia clavigera kw1407]